MLSQNRKHRDQLDRNLVADQSGLTILISGLVIAIVIGLAIRGMISPTRIRPMLESAASQIHRDLAVKIDSAHVSLSSGFLPEFVVVLSQVHMESGNSCWMSPRLFADEIRLPVSFWALMNGHNPIQRISANEVELRFLTEQSGCDSDQIQITKSFPKADVQKFVSIVSPRKAESSKYAESDISGIDIRRLLVVHEKYPRQSLDLLNLNFEVKSQKPRVYVVKAKSHLAKNMNTGDYLSAANIHIEYKEFPDRNLMLHFYGNWREGHYSLNASYKPDEDLIRFDGDLKYIPASQIFSLLNQYGVVKKEYNGKQIWLSLNSHLSGPFKEWRSLPAIINNLNIEGDLGDIAINQIQIKQLEPFQIQPFRVDLSGLNIDRVYSILNPDHIHSTLGRLGSFTGQVDYRNENQFGLRGQLSGLEFIFSNKGQREIQQVNNIVGEISLKNDMWTLDVSSAEPVKGDFKGHFQLRADHGFKKVEMKAKAESLSFNPAVQKLMTRGGRIGDLKANLQVQFNEGQLAQMRGAVSLKDLLIEGIDIENANVSLESKKDEYFISPHIQSLKIAKESPAMNILSALIVKENKAKEDLVFQSVNGLLRTKDFKYLKWKVTAGFLPLSQKFQAVGEWNELGEVYGGIQIRGQQKKDLKSWKLSGSRDEPNLTESSSNLQQEH